MTTTKKKNIRDKGKNKIVLVNWKLLTVIIPHRKDVIHGQLDLTPSPSPGERGDYARGNYEWR